MSDKIEAGYFYLDKNYPVPAGVVFRTVANSGLPFGPFIGETVQETRELEETQGNDIEQNDLYRVVLEKVEQTV